MNRDSFQKFTPEAYNAVIEYWGNEKAKGLLETLDQRFCSEIKPKLQKKYLAHFVSVLQDIVAEVVDNPLFRIFLEPTKGIRLASSEYDLKNSFTVYYPVGNDTFVPDEKLVRIYIAHELGHLYVHVLLDNDFAANKLDKNKETEIRSTLVAMVVLRDKQDFYLNVQHKKELIHKDTEALARDCLQIHRQRKNKAGHTS